jgi:phage virion morphogenesis protein
MTIEINTTQVIDVLNHLMQTVSPTGMQPIFRQIGEVLQSEIQTNLGRGQSPWGIPFDPLLRPRKSGSNGLPLNDTRQHIYNRITFNADANGVEVGMLENVPIGLTHQFGSPEKNIPARPFLPIVGGHVDLPNDWNQNVLDVVDRHLAIS